MIICVYVEKTRKLVMKKVIISDNEIKYRVNNNHEGDLELEIMNEISDVGQSKCKICDEIWETKTSENTQ